MSGQHIIGFYDCLLDWNLTSNYIYNCSYAPIKRQRRVERDIYHELYTSAVQWAMILVWKQRIGRRMGKGGVRRENNILCLCWNSCKKHVYYIMTTLLQLKVKLMLELDGITPSRKWILTPGKRSSKPNTVLYNWTRWHCLNQCLQMQHEEFGWNDRERLVL